ncbi:flagella synthesis protein FlgN [Zobellella maritima]|uniref:flagella synthesis protein FlgN n=1 Tax=Zobellella maritima TaxID=2059725 RepID=UPI000E302B98|nr:flagellar protein FlgN [Zobellella maritima]
MSLDQHLSLQVERLAQLTELLLEERHALGQGEIDGERLSRLAADKQALLIQLEKFETQRYQTQLKLGYGQDMAGAERAAQEAGCLQLWHALLEATRRTARLNSLNGTLISQRLQHNQRMLNFLHEATGQPLYGPDGQPRKSGGKLSSSA